MVSIRQLSARLSPRGWAVLGGSAAAVVLFLYLVFHLASQPSYSTLLTGLDPAQTGKITSTLDTKGIPYQIQNNGTALAVESDKTAQARIALATSGLLGSEQPGFDLFDKQQLGQSDFQQQITYQRALEGQLDQTIEQIQGVDSAQVNLVIPNAQDQLFADNSQSASASVLLDSSTLDSDSVKGIAQLVASSVPGLELDKVTITDQTGELLWPTSDDSSGDGTSKQDAEQRYDSMMAAQVGALLTQTLGPGKAQVEVNADLDTDQATSDTLTYGTKGVPLTQQTQSETLAGGNGSGGVAGNIAAAAAQTGTGASNYRNTTSDTTFGVDKTVTHDVVSPGKVNRQTVSVLVDKSVPAGEIPSLQAAVSNAVGLNPKRGDVLSFGQVAFAKPMTSSPTSPTKMIGYAKYVLAGLGALIFLFFMRRSLRRRENETFTGQPTWLRELETPRSLAALAGSSGVDQHTQVMQPLRAPVNVAKRQVEDLVERDPDRVAQQVRAWMAED